MNPLKVLITNGENLRALMFLKALAGKKDIEVHVAAKRLFSASFFSRYCRHRLLVADCKKEPGLFIQQLVDYIEKNKIDVFIPINSDELSLVLDHRNMFPESLTIPFVNADLFHKVNDKWEFAKIMHELKINVPLTIKIDKISNLENIKINFPAIIKVRKSAGSKGVLKVNNREQLIKKLKEIVKQHKLSEKSLPLVQEYIEGGEIYGAAAIAKEGKVLSVMIYKNQRQYPLEHGTSTSRISIHDSEIESSVTKILEYLKWQGIAQFDIIKKNGKNYFLEMNPRFYTSLNVTVKSGLNYPYYLCTLNENMDIPKSYKAGVVCKVGVPDTGVFLKSIFRKNKYPLKEFLNKNAKESFYDDFDWKDPLPAIPLLIKSIRGKIL